MCDPSRDQGRLAPVGETLPPIDVRAEERPDILGVVAAMVVMPGTSEGRQRAAECESCSECEKSELFVNFHCQTSKTY